MQARRILAAVAAVSLAAALTACTDTGDPMPTPSLAPSTSPSASIEPSPTPTEEEPPELLPGGTALANKEYFDYINRAFFERHPGAGSLAIAKMLIDSGFAKSSIQVTKDTTPTGRKTEAIEFSVRAHDDCLLGQWGKGKYTSYIAPVLSNGDCLIGQTLPVP